MKAAVEQARTRGDERLPELERHAFIARYEELMAAGLAAGLAANPPPERPPGQKGRLKQSPPRNLLERLWIGQDAVLGISAFLDDFTIPFDNNRAEQDLRMLKVQQKIAGSFRAESGSEAFARIRGYCATLREQGGAAQLAAAGYQLHAAVTLGQLLDYWRATGGIDAATYERVREYIAQAHG